MPGSIPFAPLFVILGRGSDLRALRIHRSSRKAKGKELWEFLFYSTATDLPTSTVYVHRSSTTVPCDRNSDPSDDLDARPCAQSCHVFRGSRFRAKMRKGTQENVITRVYHSARAREGIAFAAVNGTSERAASELRGKLSCDHRWTACGGETNQSARATGLRCVRSAPTRSPRVRHRSISFKMVLD